MADQLTFKEYYDPFTGDRNEQAMMNVDMAGERARHLIRDQLLQQQTGEAEQVPVFSERLKRVPEPRVIPAEQTTGSAGGHDLSIQNKKKFFNI